MMMLHFHARCVLLTRPFGGKVFRVLIARQKRGAQTKQLFVAIERFKPCIAYQRIFNIANMLCYKRFSVAHKTQRCFLLRPSSAHTTVRRSTECIRHAHRRWRIATGSAHELQRVACLPKFKHAHHRIVVARTYFPIVADNALHQRPKRFARLLIAGNYGLIVNIARCHDQHAPTCAHKIVHEQHLQRRIRKHYTQFI